MGGIPLPLIRQQMASEYKTQLHIKICTILHSAQESKENCDCDTLKEIDSYIVDAKNLEKKSDFIQQQQPENRFQI